MGILWGILWGIVLVIGGAVMVISPEFVYRHTQSWKNDGDCEPSDRYIFNTRFGGVMCLLVGLVGTVILLFSR